MTHCEETLTTKYEEETYGRNMRKIQYGRKTFEETRSKKHMEET